MIWYGDRVVSETLHCANHPNVETYLRCNRCAKPICTKCAVRTPVGYRCKECVRVQQKVFYKGFRPADYLIAAAVALPLSLVGGWLIPRLGWYAILLGPLAGGGIAQAARWVIRQRRGRYTWLAVCGCVVIGGLPQLIRNLLSLFVLSEIAAEAGQAGYYLSSGLMGLVWTVVYLVAATGAAYAWLRPGRRV